MKKAILIFTILLLVVFLFSQQQQQQQHDAIVRNIEVPVRVFEGGQFVSNLTMEDFEVYEDGVLQNIEALYLVDKNQIIKQEEQTESVPHTARHYYFLFQMIHYNTKLEDSIEYFFENILLPGDSLLLMTPNKNYFLSSEALSRKPSTVVAKDMLKILRKDTKIGSTAYKSQMRTMKRIVNAIAGERQSSLDSQMYTGPGSSIAMLLNRYREALEKMEELRIVHQGLFLQFAAKLKTLPGQKYIYFFYEREYRPELNQRTMNNLLTTYQNEPNVIGDLQDLFQFYHRRAVVNPEKIKQAYADASICFNFLFVDRQEKSSLGINMREQSEDFFKAFAETAKATGGIVDSSQNPSAGLKNALQATENYYLLYYSPQDHKVDGSYKKIEVKIPNKQYKIKYRHGYYANE